NNSWRSRSGSSVVRGALWPNSNLSRRRGCWDAGAAPLVRVVGLVLAIMLIPLLGAMAVWTWPQKGGRTIALLFNAISAGCSLALWRGLDETALVLQFVERHAWIPAINAEYLVGVDGLSLLLVLLTSLIIPFAILAQP